MVIKVCSFMKNEAESGKVINVNQIQNRVYEATGVFLSSLKRILKEHKRNKRVGKEFSTPHKKRPRRKIKINYFFGHYPSSQFQRKSRRFGDWNLSPSPGKTYSVL
jgi:signal recognition particle GTPase